MDDDEIKKGDTPLAQLIKEDLSSHSLDELQGRIIRLEHEIERIKKLIQSKKESQTAAESVFKNQS